MPLYAAGVGETLTPFSLAGVIPPLTFLWSISNRQIAQLKSAFYTVCVWCRYIYNIIGTSLWCVNSEIELTCCCAEYIIKCLKNFDSACC